MGEGSRLEELSLRDVGPITQLALALAPRLNLLTGDNGLGKTFILDMIWRVLTGTWAGEPALPHHRATLDKSPRPGKAKLSNKEARTIHRELHQVLGETDPFWARWMMKARTLGIEP